ncbi:hypothetical protein ES676_07465 [Bizionia saleffrena]|uniref:Uncharacterized protein n=1 Tax=Bizionia saleffrena TaxID=291189 RepID=A0A8H2LMG9_9FLAO|nr:hypothetical protein [Bizionia saleffrena]TYB74500.1 hypothetical protein ES676_07465 [Bizionia saleffrena]
MSLNSISQRSADCHFFQIFVEVNVLDTFSDMLAKDEINKMDKNKTVWAKTNDSIITPTNWNEKKDVFYQQRMETYNKSFASTEKIDLELEALEKLTINKNEYKILKNRYKDYLLNELQQPQQFENANVDEIKENKYIEVFKNDIGYSIFLAIHYIYKKKTNKQAYYSFLYYALDKDYLVCNGAKFIEFLSVLDIHIDKIDSRQSGTNKKTDLFNSIQDKYQNKHK